eukprot:TRINITY_DN56775_c0_g1_i1.p1 TRINITY_DN56775_c0_g1~~TRINITY_DN56775_c0_g1_i1.p1  ORF type:complete len:503 (-),score=50.62 TRINITY_DN56775_c0_g1_i1:40-1500(-)
MVASFGQPNRLCFRSSGVASLDDIYCALEPPTDGERSSSTSGLYTAVVWEEDTNTCSICSDKVGKMTRHHCRICGRCVCSQCSKSQLMFKGYRRLQRGCTTCVANIQALYSVKKRLSRLHGQLAGLAGSFAPSADEFGSLVDAMGQCEEAVQPLENALAAAVARAERAEAEAVAARKARDSVEAAAFTFLCTLGERLHRLPVGKNWLAGASREPPQPGDGMLQATAYCEAALEPIANSLRKPRRKWSRPHSRPQSDTEATEADGSEACSPMTSVFSSVGRPPSQADSAAPSIMTDFSHALAPAPVVSPTNPQWEEDADSCGVCSISLGKRYFRRRHHCRLCGRCVCGQCSPSNILVDGKLQRACNLCVQEAQQIPALREKVSMIHERLSTLTEGSPEDRGSPLSHKASTSPQISGRWSEGSMSPPPTTRTLSEALMNLDATIRPMEDIRQNGSTRPGSSCASHSCDVTPSSDDMCLVVERNLSAFR